MSSARNIFVWCGRGLALVCGLLMLVACETLSDGSGDGQIATNNVSWKEISTGEQLTIELRDIPPPDQKIEQTVQDDGTVALTFNMKIVAAGKTVNQLRDEIHDLYVPRYYKNISVFIKRENLSFFVGGEVKTPGRLQYIGDITVTKAIQAAGDFTVFADKKNIKVIRRNGKIEKVNYYNAIKKPKLDLPLYPGDQVIVPLRLV
jgi:protein involved in polysaccharide export with SLBB domain